VVVDAERVVYVDQVEGTRSVRMFTAVGTTVPAHTTGAGKAIMAHWEPGAVAALYGPREPLQQLTPRTLVTVAELDDDFGRIRDRGYAVDNEEHELGVGCVAAPVFDHTGRPAAAISVSGPSARILEADPAALGSLIADRARQVSEALGQPGAAVAAPA
jgi:DNA-binding IclR family transcriptional regulator